MTSHVEKYNFREIEPKWQALWEEKKFFQSSAIPKKEKYYVLMMFAYPSGKLHMGHVFNYTIGDVAMRYNYILGKDCLFPFGWDAFGLPAENAAIAAGVHPAKWTYENIAEMKRQCQSMGWGFDWDREFATCDPGYYKWNQWLFIQMLKKGIAYRRKTLVNWDPVEQTVLANEQVVDGRGWRSGVLVEQKEINSWFLNITAYADELYNDLQKLEGRWPPQVIEMQRNWIGRSEGARIDFVIEAPGTSVHGQTLSVFTTRPDTLYGVTFIALAPEHPVVAVAEKALSAPADLKTGIQRMKAQSSQDRSSENSPKEGAFLGIHAKHPLTDEKIPLWACNYALMDYGTGAVMAVPAHDQRDFFFAKEYGLPLKVVIQPEGESLRPENMEAAHTDNGRQVNSGSFDGLTNQDAKRKITEKLKALGKGDFQINFRLRDWNFSRQRYWGTPIPVIYDEDGTPWPVPEKELPVAHPRDIEFKGLGGNPMERDPKFLAAIVPEGPHKGKPGRRETDTMDTFIDSSWYMLRYPDAKNDAQIFNPEKVQAWCPIDQYVGGIEHATGHLIFSRFISKVLRDLGCLRFDEPFAKLLSNGMVCATAYKAETFSDEKGKTYNGREVRRKTIDNQIRYFLDSGAEVTLTSTEWVPTEEVDAGNPENPRRASDGWPLDFEMTKMSKSKKNGVSPDRLLDEFGADTLRLYILSDSPPDQEKFYSENGVRGANRFVFRFWDMMLGQLKNISSVKVFSPKSGDILNAEEKEYRRLVHDSIQKVSKALDTFSFNTAISQLHVLANGLKQTEQVRPEIIREGWEAALSLCAPFIPHVAEELWNRAGAKDSIFKKPMPFFDPKAVESSTLEYPVQINGKLRATLIVEKTAPIAEIEKIALSDEKIRPHFEGKTVQKCIVVPGKIINIVVKG